MLRLANPGSDISSFTRIFQALYEDLQGTQPFSLDDMSAALVRRGLATSSGYSGDQALARSTRADRSRDPLYNQSKMYSELFRYLGWMNPSADSQLAFTLTWLGHHIAEAGANAKPLVAECVLSMVVPNFVVTAQGEYHLRFHACILRATAALDSLICRDELIVGPLSLADDTDAPAFADMVTRIRKMRNGSPSRLANAVDALSSKRGIQVNTLQNYTRFPLAALEWTGWTEKIRDRTNYGSAVVFHRLTAAGVAASSTLASTHDLRADCLKGASSEVVAAAAQLGAVCMLERAGFDASNLTDSRESWIKTLRDRRLIPRSATALLFNPFTELPAKTSALIFAATRKYSTTSARRTVRESPPRQTGRNTAAATLIHLGAGSSGIAAVTPEDARLAAALLTKLSARKSLAAIADGLCSEYASSNKNVFYPLVAALFRIVGYDCTASRVGVNYQRWDALIQHPRQSVPIEVKSPGEELFISTKGVRQALENKVILLSRKLVPTTRDTTSLVVGFQAPNERSEVNDLVEDIFGSYGIRIGVMDFRSLVLLAAGAAHSLPHDPRTLLSLKGFVDVTTT